MNLDTADEVRIQADTQSLKNKLSLFKKDIFDDALAQVLDTVNDRQNLQGKNAAYLKKNGKK